MCNVTYVMWHMTHFSWNVTFLNIAWIIDIILYSVSGLFLVPFITKLPSYWTLKSVKIQQFSTFLVKISIANGRGYFEELDHSVLGKNACIYVVNNIFDDFCDWWKWPHYSTPLSLLWHISSLTHSLTHSLNWI